MSENGRHPKRNQNGQRVDGGGGVHNGGGVRKHDTTSAMNKQIISGSTNNKRMNGQGKMITGTPYGLPNVGAGLKKLVRCIEPDARDFVFGWCW